jgi:hypothetical protein
MQLMQSEMIIQEGYRRLRRRFASVELNYLCPSVFIWGESQLIFPNLQNKNGARDGPGRRSCLFET